MTQEEQKELDTIYHAASHTCKAFLHAWGKFERTGEQKWKEIADVFEISLCKLAAQAQEYDNR